MAFKMRSGNGPLAFKNMGSSPNKVKIGDFQPSNIISDLGDTKTKMAVRSERSKGPSEKTKNQIELDKAVIDLQAKQVGKPKTTETKKKKPTVKDNFGEGSEKTKRLKSKLQTQDTKTTDAYVEGEMAKAREGKYGKGLFGGAIRRKLAKAKHKRKGRQEDKTREKLGESERYDKLSPEQKAVEKAKKKQDFQDAANRVAISIDPKTSSVDVANFDESVRSRGSQAILDAERESLTRARNDEQVETLEGGKEKLPENQTTSQTKGGDEEFESVVDKLKKESK